MSTTKSTKKVVRALLRDDVPDDLAEQLAHVVAVAKDPITLQLLRDHGYTSQPKLLTPIEPVTKVSERFADRETPELAEKYLAPGYQVALNKYQRKALRNRLGYTPTKTCEVLEAYTDERGRVVQVRLSTYHTKEEKKRIQGQFVLNWPEFIQEVKDLQSYDDIVEESKIKKSKPKPKPSDPDNMKDLLDLLIR